MIREEDVLYSMIIAHYFPSESGRNSPTVSECTNTASIQNWDLTNIKYKIDILAF
jgi:hypothetical protein